MLYIIMTFNIYIVKEKEPSMPKKIKSFTVDEEVYSALVSMFQRYKTGVSVSLFVNEKLKQLLVKLTEFENLLEHSSLTLTMDYVINKVVTGIENERMAIPATSTYPGGWEGNIKKEEELRRI